MSNFMNGQIVNTRRFVWLGPVLLKEFRVATTHRRAICNSFAINTYTVHNNEVEQSCVFTAVVRHTRTSVDCGCCVVTNVTKCVTAFRTFQIYCDGVVRSDNMV